MTGCERARCAVRCGGGRQAHFAETLRLDPDRADAATRLRACEGRMPAADPAPVTSFYSQRVSRGIQEARSRPGPDGD